MVIHDDILSSSSSVSRFSPFAVGAITGHRVHGEECERTTNTYVAIACPGGTTRGHFSTRLLQHAKGYSVR